MINLLKANFYRLVREKAIYILCLVTILMHFITLLTLFMMKELSELITISGEVLFLSGMQLGNNIGILFAIAAPIILGKEFSQNTIRNKISIGYSKTKIFLSNLILAITVTLIIYFVYELLIFTTVVPIYGWGGEFILASFAKQLINSILILITYSAVLNLVSMLTRSMLAGILVGLFGTILAVVIMQGIMMLPVEGIWVDIIDILAKINFVGQSLLVSTTKTSFMIYVLVSSVITVSVTTLVGCWAFEKLDIK